MVNRLLHFVLGAVFALTTLTLFWLWDSYKGFRTQQNIERQMASLWMPSVRKPLPPLSLENLVGSWSGRESWGTTYTINRRSDGTFSQVVDRRGSDDHSPREPAITRWEGRWAVNGFQYGCYYTKRNDQPIGDSGLHLFMLKPLSSVEFTYYADEGNGVDEHKSH